ncbi:hypothetical protein D9I87_08555 [Escherichia coli]|nr:hypothetical protein [Escherichia coli]
MSTHTFTKHLHEFITKHLHEFITKHLHEFIFYTPHGCETTTGAFLSEVSPITTKYRRKKRWNASWHTDIQMK